MSAHATTTLDGEGGHDLGAAMDHYDEPSICMICMELTVLCLLRCIVGYNHPLYDVASVDRGDDHVNH